MARVLIGANSEVVRTGLEAMLAILPRFSVVGSFGIDDALLARIENSQPDVVLLDLESAPDELLPLELKDGPFSAALVVLSDNTEGSWTIEALRSGVRAIVPRDASAGEIRAAIQAAEMGLVVLQADAFDPVLSPVPGRFELDPSDQILTPREIEVLRMMAAGLGNKEIASQLTISGHTVKFHISSIFAKLGASSRTEAVTLGIRRGLIMI